MLFNAIPMLRVRNREMLKKKKKNRQQRIINGPTLYILIYIFENNKIS